MLQETLFHNANGYLGVRGCLEEGVPEDWNTMRGMYVNGFYDVVDMKQAESLCNLTEEKDTMLNVADVQTVELYFGGERLSVLDPDTSFTRLLDMDKGITQRDILRRGSDGSEAHVRFTRMASFAEKNLFTVECEIHSLSFTGDITVRSLQKALVHNYSSPDDPRLGDTSSQLLSPAGSCVRDGAAYLLTKTRRSGLSVCTGVKHDFPDGCGELCLDESELTATVTWSAHIEPGETLRFVKYAVVTDSLRCGDCMAENEKCLERVFGQVNVLYKKQAAYLSAFWESASMEIDSDDESQLAMCFNQYQLLQSCGGDSLCGTASKGLSGEGYEGHYFWDTEIYVLPFFTYTAPQLARRLLEYRYSTLPLARENARLMGHKQGALYPWRTISGRECSGFFPAGSAQYHINGDIACAVVRYYSATGDTDFLARFGGEILLETARLWMDTGNMSGGRFIINDVTGPDEYTCIVNNNYYTNACARYNLLWAYRCSEILRKAGLWEDLSEKLSVTDGELASFREAAEKMYLPYDEALGINPQDDSFLQKPVWDFAGTPRENYPLLLHYHPLYLYRHQVCKQADTILAYLLYGVNETRETMLRSFEYYEKITTHDSSLSNCIFSIVASRLGQREKAWSYFGESIKSDLVNSHGNTGDGIHTANMGGSYMMIVNGFAGMEISESGLSVDPFLPEAWRGYRFRIHYRDCLAEIAVRRGECSVRLLSGEKLEISVCGKAVCLTPGENTFTSSIA